MPGFDRSRCHRKLRLSKTPTGALPKSQAIDLDQQDNAFGTRRRARRRNCSGDAAIDTLDQIERNAGIGHNRYVTDVVDQWTVNAAPEKDGTGSEQQGEAHGDGNSKAASEHDDPGQVILNLLENSPFIVSVELTRRLKGREERRGRCELTVTGLTTRFSLGIRTPMLNRPVLVEMGQRPDVVQIEGALGKGKG